MVKFSIYLNRRVFEMLSDKFDKDISSFVADDIIKLIKIKPEISCKSSTLQIIVMKCKV